MTFEYGKVDEQQGEFFRNSQFLVFINRILAFMIGMTVIFLQRQPYAPCRPAIQNTKVNILETGF
jgi:hypothetical protein